MSEIFDGYERQYCELSKNISRKAANASVANGEQRKERLLELKNGMEEAESLVRRMDLEARTLPTTQKAMLLAKLREYKADLTNLKREVKKAASVDTAAARDELLESGMGAELTLTSARGCYPTQLSSVIRRTA